MSAATVILMYHRVLAARDDPWMMCVSPDNFDAQLSAIRRVAEPLSLADYLLASREDRLPARSVVLTFDDGYVDNLEQALPRLSRHDIPATLYVTTANVGTTREFWWDRLETLLLGPDALPGELVLALPGGEASWTLDGAALHTVQTRALDRETPAWSARPGTRLRFFYEVWKVLWPLPDAQREPLLADVAAWAGGTGVDPTRRTMDRDEIRRIAASGLVSIGAHTIDHPPLPAHPREIQHAQIRGSQATLEDILGRPVVHFAYPHGEHSQDTVDLLRELGFDSAVTVQQRIAVRDSDPMRLPRFGVKDLPGGEFEAELRTRFERHEAVAAGG